MFLADFLETGKSILKGFSYIWRRNILGTFSRIYNENGKLIGEKFYQQMQIKGSLLGDFKLHNSFCP
jgi:hypothetical protein